MVRFMVMHKATEQAEAGAEPHDGTGRLIDEMVRAGVLLAAEDLLPSSAGARVSVSGGTRTVTGGPFTGTKELVSGFALIEVRSREEAVEWAARLAEAVGDVELRQVAEPPA
ncbi:YciI family protein [Sphaerisporangium sp. NBC_01403]|uniref:YciI family protein n=1 Tax=Sphaerisporangium sp. NBC_01403 TaxID=2903599 RepID=UPI0032438AAB